MLTEKERQEFFRDIIARNREAIIEKWSAHLQLNVESADSPGKGLNERVSFALKAAGTHICNDDTSIADAFLKKAAKQRMAAGQPMNAVLNASEGFRVALTPLVIKEADPEDMGDLLADINRVVSYSHKVFIDEYQALAASLINRKGDELSHAVEVRDNFFINVGHEFRTPLTIIQGFSKMLESGKTPPESVAKLAGNIHMAGETLLKMVSDLILVAKLRGDTAKPGAAHMYMKELTESAQQDAINMAPAKVHVWEKHHADNDPMVTGDYEMLRVMLGHIMNNAIKFSPKDSRIIVTTRVEGEFIYIDVMDEGVGVEKGDFDFIFESFSQKESHATRKFEGAGIGLYLARQVACLHGGDLMVAKRDGTAGSVFTVSLPLAEKPAVS